MNGGADGARGGIEPRQHMGDYAAQSDEFGIRRCTSPWRECSGGKSRKATELMWRCAAALRGGAAYRQAGPSRSVSPRQFQLLLLIPPDQGVTPTEQQWRLTCFPPACTKGQPPQIQLAAAVNMANLYRRTANRGPAGAVREIRPTIHARLLPRANCDGDLKFDTPSHRRFFSYQHHHKACLFDGQRANAGPSLSRVQSNTGVIRYVGKFEHKAEEHVARSDH